MDAIGNDNIASTHRFGVSEQQLIRLHQQWNSATAEFGSESEQALISLARLCVGYGLRGQELASPSQLWKAIEVFGRIADQDPQAGEADFEGALTMSVLALTIVQRDIRRNVKAAIVYSNMAFLILEANKANPIDVAGAAHVGAIAWDWRGGRQAKASVRKALNLAREHLGKAENVQAGVLAQHDWVQSLVGR